MKSTNTSITRIKNDTNRLRNDYEHVVSTKGKNKRRNESMTDSSEAELSDTSDAEWSYTGEDVVDSDDFEDEDNFDEDEDEIASEDELSSDPKIRAQQLRRKHFAPSDDSEDETLDFSKQYTTIGNIPTEWYEDMPHLGYDVDGKRVTKPVSKDELDALLQKMDDPDYLATFTDTTQHKDVKLTDQELDIISRLQSLQYPDAEMDPYPRFEDMFTQDVMVTPLTATPEPKSRFIPSKWEHKRVMKLVRLIRAGVILPNGRRKKTEEEERQAEKKPEYYDLWADNAPDRAEHPTHIPAPKMKLPDHAESYNPPEEYLLDEEELKAYNETDPEDRTRNFIPKKFPNLRSVPAYDRFIHERFERCLDLYLSPRAIRKRVTDPNSLLPDLPDPKELEPYPKELAVEYKVLDNEEPSKARCTSFSPCGQWIVSGYESGELRLWEVLTGRCMKMWRFDSVGEDGITSVAWNPSKTVSVIAVGVNKTVLLINPEVADDPIMDTTDELLSLKGASEKQTRTIWAKPPVKQQERGIKLSLALPAPVIQVTWHRKGDYFVSVSAVSHGMSQGDAVQIHQLSKQQSQSPFSKSQGEIQRVLFHPSQPLFFVATRQSVRVYNLVRQELSKKLQPGVKWISSMDIHPRGDNLIVGSYDKKVCWFDTDLSTKPYKVLRHHDYAIRDVSFHRRYPLFASCSDDGRIQIFHGMVYNDLMQNPLIVPVKILHAHKRTDSKLGTLSCEFHPFRPWVLSSGADGAVKLFS